MMRVLGIDCGSQITGYGVVDTDEQRHELVAAGALRLSARQDFSQKLLKIQQDVEHLIVTYSPTAVAVEDQFYFSNFKSVLKLGQVKGVILLTAAKVGLPIFEYSPLAIKSAVTGYGRAEKGQVQIMVQKLLRLAEPPQPFDTADALALAICHIHTETTRQRLETDSNPRVPGLNRALPT